MKWPNKLLIQLPRIFLAIRYLIIAVLAYGIDFGGYVYLIHHSYSPVMANIIVKVFAALFGFCGHRYFTYGLLEHSHIIKHAIKYFGLALLYTPISTACLYLVVLFWPNPIYAKLLVDIMLYILTFAVTSMFVFTIPKKTSVIKSLGV